MWISLSDEERLALRIALARKRAKQPKAHSLGSRRDPATKLNRRRASNETVKRHRRKLTKRRAWGIELTKVVMAQRYRANAILDALYPRRATEWIPVLKRNRLARVTIDVPSLSFFRDPAAALEKFANIARAEAEYVDIRVNFTFDRCEDIGPILMMSEAWPAFLPVFSGGNMEPPVQKVIESVGLGRALKMNFPNLTDLNGVFAIPARRRRSAGSSNSLTRDLDAQTREAVQDDICDLIDGWLDVCGSTCALSDHGRSHLSAMVGEVLDNAERHSSYSDKDGSWSVAGVMTHRVTEDGQDEFKCLLAFLSVGATISESLEATAAPSVMAQLGALLTMFQKTAKASQSRDTLLTLAAIQDGVTRDPEAFDEERGGTGLLDIVDFVRMLGSKLDGTSDAEIAVVSGRSCILMRAPHIEGIRSEPGAGRRIWFNDANTTSVPPNSEHVFDLPYRLPGTIISVAFTLEPEMFRNAVDGGN